MNLSNNINLHQKQIISQHLKLYVQILQMNCYELNAYIEHQSLINPVIEIEPYFDEEEYDEKLMRKLDWLEEKDRENLVYKDFLPEEDKHEATFISQEDNRIQDHLISQLGLLPLSKSEYNIAKYIIYSLDERGYLDLDVEIASNIFNVDEMEINKIIDIVRNLNPSGIGARNLSECLSIQLRQKGIENEMIYRIVNNHLDLLAKNKLDIISKILNISIDEVKNHVSIIKRLNPKPLNSYNSYPQTLYVRPDIFVVKYKDNFEVLLNESQKLTFNISDFYKSLLKNSTDRETKNYISQKINQAMWVKQCIFQSNNTLKAVSKSIVEKQIEFFKSGPKHLIPLKMKDIAKMLSIHESNVSRSIRRKYLQCFWGVFELKYFFPSGCNYEFEDKISSESVKIMIKDIISTENKQNPFCDQKIVDILAKNGVTIARRTVSKYREDIGILSANLRKNY